MIGFEYYTSTLRIIKSTLPFVTSHLNLYTVNGLFLHNFLKIMHSYLSKLVTDPEIFIYKDNICIKE